MRFGAINMNRLYLKVPHFRQEALIQSGGNIKAMQIIQDAVDINM